MSAPFHARDGRRVPPQLRELRLEREQIRIPDRVGLERELKDRSLRRFYPVGRPGDIFGDVVITLARVRFEGAS